MLTVSVKNLGPITKGTVDLKPLTIFVGPSNTGKSYMATAIHALMKSLRGDSLVPPTRIFVGREMYTDKAFGALWLMPDEDSDIGKVVWSWARQLNEEGLDPQPLTFSSLPEAMRVGWQATAFQELSRARSDTISHLGEAYGGPSTFVTRGVKPTDFRLTLHREEPPLHMDIPLLEEENATLRFDVSDAELEPSPLAILEYEPKQGEEPIDIFYEVLASWMESLEENVLDGVPYESYYLPAGRSGIIQGSKVLGAQIIRHFGRRRRSESIFPVLPVITTEFLGHLISLDRRMLGSTRGSAMDDAIAFIENEVLHGRIDLDESSGLPVPELVYIPTGAQSDAGKFTLDMVSSMVSELAPLIMFLKYLVGQGDLLILEEPESHLHPAAQRRMAQGIVRLVNAGVKVIITTHSDLFVGQINNSLALRNASPELIEEHGFCSSDFLKQEQVSAHIFKYDQELGGSVIQPLEIDPDTGIGEEEFADVIEAIYNESIALQRDRTE